MESLNEYRELAKSVDVAEFLSRCAPLFLVKRPQATLVRVEPPSTEFKFQTSVTGELTDPFPTEYRVSPIRKNPDNPFPDRMSVGRAPNCDVVVRMPFVSKVHAHLTYSDSGTLLLRPSRSAKTTRVNGREVGADQLIEVKPGDQVSLGVITLEIMTVRDLRTLVGSLEAGRK